MLAGRDTLDGLAPWYQIHVHQYSLHHPLVMRNVTHPYESLSNMEDVPVVQRFADFRAYIIAQILQRDLT